MDPCLDRTVHGEGAEEMKTPNPETYNEKAPLPTILAVDFDGTLVEDKYPLIGGINKPVWDAVIAAKDAGCRIILWTCRAEEMLYAATAFCADNGLHPDEVNRNIPEVIAMYGGDTRKVFADLYIDDRNGSISDIYDLLEERDGT